MKLLEKISNFYPFNKKPLILNQEDEPQKISEIHQHFLHNNNSEESYKFIIFSMCYIALAADLIAVDREANDVEIETFLNSFEVNTDDEVSKITDLFYLATITPSHKEEYLSKLARLFDKNYQPLQELINNLVKIAVYDDYISNSETRWLIETGAYFGIESAQVIELIKHHLALKNADFDPVKMLGLNHRTLTLRALNKNYRFYANIYHPDRYLQYDVSEEYIEDAKEKFHQLTVLYQKIKRQKIS